MKTPVYLKRGKRLDGSFYYAFEVNGFYHPSNGASLIEMINSIIGFYTNIELVQTWSKK